MKIIPKIIVPGILLIIPAIIGAGAIWHFFHRYEVIILWVILLYGVSSVIVAIKLLSIDPPILSPAQLGYKTLTTARSGLEIIVGKLEKSPLFYIWLSILAAMILFAVYSLLASLILSMEILEFSLKIPWAALVSSYTWLVVAGSGLCIINGLGGVFGMVRYEIMGKRIAFLSLISIIFGLNYILLHLGRPERVLIYNVISPNFHSAIAWMGALYTIYIIIVFVEFWLLIRSGLAETAEHSEGLKKTIYTLLALKRPRDAFFGRFLGDSKLGRILYNPRLDRGLTNPLLLKTLGVLAFVTGVAALTMLGSVFAHTESRALWYGGYYPVYFIISALFTGYALLLVVTIITSIFEGDELLPKVKDLIFEMSQALALLLAIGFAFSVYRLVSGLFDTERQEAVMLFLTGPFSLNFWVFEVGMMSFVPAFILLWAAKKKNIIGALVASVFVLLGAFVMRFDFVVAGQILPNIKQGLPSYFPTIMEILLIVGVLGGFLFVYSMGEKFLPLKAERVS